MGSDNVRVGFGTLLGGLKVRYSHRKAAYLKRKHETSVQIPQLPGFQGGKKAPELLSKSET
jgi:hypothetical protein